MLLQAVRSYSYLICSGTIREERIIARMPLQDPSGSRNASSRRYAEVYTLGPDDALRSSTSSRPPIAVPPPQGRASDTGVTPSMHPSELQSVPPLLPVAVEAPIMTPQMHIPNIVPGPPPPPPPPPLQDHFRSRSYGLSNSSDQEPLRMQRASSERAPQGWPLPPSREAASRAHLATVRDRIMARLFDMGIRTAPNVMELVNRYTERDANVNEEEVLANILNSINIRGTPSPRIPDHQHRR